MNILPKKRWHVRTKENIERVRRDEENAAEEEKERQRRIALAESEARTEQLREKARKRNRNEDVVHEEAVVASSTTGGHVNFFEDIEKGEKVKKANDEYEKEKKEEKEKQEKAIGLLTYLGQSAVEAQTSKPWYFSPPKKKKRSSEKETKSSKDEFDLKGKMRHDPLLDMMKYVDTTEKVKSHKEKSSGHSHKEHKGKKHKSDKKNDKEKSKPCGPKTKEQLRAERLKREQVERHRTQELLARVHGHARPDIQEETDERKRGYNSQFNPSLARKWKPSNGPQSYDT